MARIVDAAGILPEDRVLEIGPGPGIMTRDLCARAAHVTAIELDERLAGALGMDAPENLDIIQGDAVKVPWPAWDVQVSNLPYQISSPALFKILETDGWRTCVLLLQREFAERLVAKPGTKVYGRLSVGAQFGARIEIVERVPAGAFHPAPRVESAVVRLTPIPPPFVVEGPEHRVLFQQVVQAAFTNRRKKLGNAIASGAHLIDAPRGTLAEALKDIPRKDDRPEALDVVAFGDVSRHIYSRVKAK